MSANKHQPWLTIKEIEIADIPIRSIWWPLFNELVRRLEQTTPPFALEIHMDSHKSARKAHFALCRLFRRRIGPHAVTLTYSQPPEEPVLYVQRGPKWGKPANGHKPK